MSAATSEDDVSPNKEIDEDDRRAKYNKIQKKHDKRQTLIASTPRPHTKLSRPQRVTVQGPEQAGQPPQCGDVVEATRPPRVAPGQPPRAARGQGSAS